MFLSSSAADLQPVIKQHLVLSRQDKVTLGVGATSILWRLRVLEGNLNLLHKLHCATFTFCLLMWKLCPSLQDTGVRNQHNPDLIAVKLPAEPLRNQHFSRICVRAFQNLWQPAIFISYVATVGIILLIISIIFTEPFTNMRHIMNKFTSKSPH